MLVDVHNFQRTQGCVFTTSPDASDEFRRPQLLKKLTGAAGYKTRLKPNAVPTILSHKESKHPQEASEIRSQKRKRQEMLSL